MSGKILQLCGCVHVRAYMNKDWPEANKGCAECRKKKAGMVWLHVETETVLCDDCHEKAHGRIM